MIRFIAAFAALTALTITAPPPAQSEVLIAPTRVILDRSERSTELVVVNKGNEEAAFRISIENRRMRLDGSMEEISEPLDGEVFASDILRYSPRRIVLAPGERQTVRVSAMLRPDLEPGEYRSHLRLMGAPLSAGRTLTSATNTERADLSIQLVAIRSITIPVIVRIGDLGADVEIETVALQETETEDETLLVARMSRTGNRSTYGDIKLFVEGQAEPIYYAKGIAIYTPNTERDLLLPLPDIIRDAIAGQHIRLEYISADPSAPGLIAATSTRLP